MDNITAHFIIARPFLIEKKDFSLIQEGLAKLLDCALDFGISIKGFNSLGEPKMTLATIEFNGNDLQGFHGLSLKKFINSQDEVQMIETRNEEHSLEEYDVFVVAFLELCTEVLGNDFLYVSTGGEESRVKGKSLLEYSK
jgi:hypothetical protein